MDLKFVRENVDIVREALRKRSSDFPLDELLNLDKRRRGLITTLQELRHKRNVVSELIAKKKADGENVSKLILEMKEVNREIDELENDLREAEASLKTLLLKMPNLVHESVPPGPDESYNLEIRRWGIPRLLEGPDHIDIGLGMNLIDLERAAKVAGSRFYYLKEDLVRLNYALISYGLDFGLNKGFKLLQPPYML